MSCVLPHLLQRAKALYRTGEFGCSRRRCFLYAKLQLHDWTHIVRCLDGSVKVRFPQRVVDKPVSKWLSYPVTRPVQSTRLPDCPNNKQQNLN